MTDRVYWVPNVSPDGTPTPNDLADGVEITQYLATDPSIEIYLRRDDVLMLDALAFTREVFDAHLAAAREEGRQQGMRDATVRYADLVANLRSFLEHHDKHGWGDVTPELGPKWLDPVRRSLAALPAQTKETTDGR